MDNRKHIIRRGDRRFWTIIIAITIAELAVFVAVQQWEYVFPSSAVRRLYNHYRNADDINAIYVKGYKINDSVKTDVTILEALTDSSWASLCDELCITLPPPEILEYFRDDLPAVKYAPKRDYCKPYEKENDLDSSDVIVTIYREHKITVFNIENEQERNIIFTHGLFK